MRAQGRLRRLLRHRSLQAFLVLFLYLLCGRNLIHGFEELEGRIHLVFHIPELVVYGPGRLFFRSDIPILDQLFLFVPGVAAVDLTAGLEVNPLGIKGRAQPYLKEVLVFSVNSQFEGDISLYLHSVIYRNRGPKMAQFYPESSNPICKYTHYKALKQGFLEEVILYFRIPLPPLTCNNKRNELARLRLFVCWSAKPRAAGQG